MDFSIMFWGNMAPDSDPSQKYELLLKASQFADQQGFKALWIPERHFHPWGGLFPNPSVICAALATITKQIRLRAGSVVAPLHHPLRIAEEWAVVDNLSNGRVELAMASGWKDDDFVLAPEGYSTRKSGHMKAIEMVSALWRGDACEFKNGSGEMVSIQTYPRPIQPDLPLWVTSAGSIKSMTRAGNGGFNLLTHLLGQSFEELDQKIKQYQAYRVNGGFKTKGKISLMLHTFMGQDIETVRETVKKPLSEYLKQSIELAIPADLRAQWETADTSLRDKMVEDSFNRYFDTSALMGTGDSCERIVNKVKALGVTDICCLIDFGLPAEQVLKSLELLTLLKNKFN